MWKWLIRNRLRAFERTFDYDATYAHEILDADVRAFLAVARLSGLSSYKRDVPRDAYYGAKLVATLAEDCGPCTQLAVTMALRDGVAPRTVAAVLAGGPVSEEARLGADFARAVLARSSEADALRGEVVRRWGRRALVALAFAVTGARLYPTLKYALGHGEVCRRVVVAGEPIAFAGGRVVRAEA